MERREWSAEDALRAAARVGTKDLEQRWPLLSVRLFIDSKNCPARGAPRCRSRFLHNLLLSWTGLRQGMTGCTNSNSMDTECSVISRIGKRASGAAIARIGLPNFRKSRALYKRLRPRKRLWTARS